MQGFRGGFRVWGSRGLGFRGFGGLHLRCQCPAAAIGLELCLGGEWGVQIRAP